MNEFELETFEMIIEMYSHNDFLANQMIGSYSIGLSTLYRSENHEMFRQWIGIFHKDSPNYIVGYLKLDAFIVGPGDKPPSHATGEGDEDDAEF